jgi:hypothetical protein
MTDVDLVIATLERRGEPTRSTGRERPTLAGVDVLIDGSLRVDGGSAATERSRTTAASGACRGSRCCDSALYHVVVARRPDVPADPALVVVNPDDEVTSESFAAWLDRRQVGKPVDPGVTAADTLAEARAAGEV